MDEIEEASGEREEEESRGAVTPSMQVAPDSSSILQRMVHESLFSLSGRMNLIHCIWSARPLFLLTIPMGKVREVGRSGISGMTALITSGFPRGRLRRLRREFASITRLVKGEWIF